MSKQLLDIQKQYMTLGIGSLPQTALDKAHHQAGHIVVNNSEIGKRATPENQMLYLTRQMWVDPTLRAAILDIRHMDRIDTRVKRIHNKMASTAIKSGLVLKVESTNKTLIKHWRTFAQRLNLHRRAKLKSDARGLIMDGNLPIQWVLNQDNQIVGGVRMPSETIVPQVTEAGLFKDPRKAYAQYDLTLGTITEYFALWRLSMVRLDPDNFDDMGAMGRPYLDATRGPWKKLTMTEEDLVIRRKTRAQQRKVHQLKNVSNEFYTEYKADIEADKYDQAADYVIQGEGDVKAISGDANLNQIADVVHLLDTFFAGAPAPKGLFGYVGDLSRDILEDLRKDFFEEIDALQDEQSFVYELGFRLHLLLNGINPENEDFAVLFAERVTETQNQAADRALKWQALGFSFETILEAAGVDPSKEKDRLKRQSKEINPYPDDEDGEPKPPKRPGKVSVTPGNQRKGESATTIATRN